MTQNKDFHIRSLQKELDRMNLAMQLATQRIQDLEVELRDKEYVFNQEVKVLKEQLELAYADLRTLRGKDE